MHVLCANFFYENAEIVIQNLKATQQRLMEYARFGISTAKARNDLADQKILSARAE